MRQVLANSNGVFVARMPRPVVDKGAILVRTRYSLISTGTEVAAVQPLTKALEDASRLERAKVYSSLAREYAGKAWRNPRKAASKVSQIVKSRLAHERQPVAVGPTIEIGGDKIGWSQDAAENFVVTGDAVQMVTDRSAALYQAKSIPLQVPDGYVVLVKLTGEISGSSINLGALNHTQDSWLGMNTLSIGQLDENLYFKPDGSPTVTLVFSNSGTGKSASVDLTQLSVSLLPPREDGKPHSETTDQGWNLGYSLSGEVIAIGEGISDIGVGDVVACAGAGQANHADYVVVKRNLVCRVPDGCSASAAATATVGSIAMQGIRRAKPQLGESVCVIGLGLIGQMTVQMLRANGCSVIGSDLDPTRIERAMSGGLTKGTTDTDELRKIVRDLTGGNGVDQTIIAAATKSSAIVNLAMELTRRKGTVVIVGDIGMDVAREDFYRKEIDLLISSSYGPGRYDAQYEEDGIDYPFGYVRWTMNRNMRAYLDLIAAEQLDIDSLIDLVVPIDNARQTYRDLAAGGEEKPLGVLLDYGAFETEPQTETKPESIVLRGHRQTPPDRINYVLVGAGAFGTSMLVPQMERRRDLFSLRGVVSRDTVRGGNFARNFRVETLTTDLEAVLKEPDFDLMVIATRHDVHADQAVQCLTAGKHVFVEKPLAITWDQYENVVSTYRRVENPPLLMVGFNRRFSPALQKVMELVRDRRGPLMINYRMNAGYIPPDNWVQGPQGGGRNIGEACHIYDIFRALAGAPVAEVSATPIIPRSDAHLRNDNFTATILYEDGTVGNLLYTAQGPREGLAKERAEIFCDGEAYIVDDYKSLYKAGDKSPLWTSNEVDKGHFDQLVRLGNAIVEGGSSPIEPEVIFETTAVALTVEDQLFGRFRADD